MTYPLKYGNTNQIACFVAYDSDWSIKDNLNASGITSIRATRVGDSDVPFSGLTDKSNPNDSHVDGALYNNGAGDYLIDLPDSTIATYAPSLQLQGTWLDNGNATSGVIVGYRHPIVGYDVTDPSGLGLSHFDTIISDTSELQTDWTNGGRLDLLLDSVVSYVSNSGVVVDSDTADQIADAILTRDWTEVTGEAARSTLNALRLLRNKVSESTGTLTVTKEDDSTEAWTAAVTTSANADPITEIDPA